MVVDGGGWWLLTLKAEITKQRNIFGALFALGQLGEDKESPESLALANTQTL